MVSSKPPGLPLGRQDVGNVVWMEHIYLEVPDLEAARLFYAKGLGLVQEPNACTDDKAGQRLVCYNIGGQQFHIAKGPKAQRLPPGGIIGLVLPDVQQAAKQLQDVAAQLPAGQKPWLQARSGTAACPQWLVYDSCGVQFMLHQAGSLPGVPFNAGIAYLHLPCHKGSIQSICSFYKSYLGAAVQVESGRNVAKCTVVIGPGMSLVFLEDQRLGRFSEQAAMQLFEGWHIALYIAQFSSTYSKLAEAGLIDTKTRLRDECHGEVLADCQFRFSDIPELYHEGSEISAAAPGNLTSATTFWRLAGRSRSCYRISHEVRSLYHPSFMATMYSRRG